MAAEDEVKKEGDEVKKEEPEEEKKEEEAEKPAETEPVAEEKPKEPEKPKELEEDAKEVSGPVIAAGACSFLTEDTTLNALPVADGKLMMTLDDGGFQYLMAGARASAGLKGGRYMFEIKIIENKSPSEPQNARAQSPKPKQYIRMGFATSEAGLLMSDDLCVFFDSDGSFGPAKTRAGTRFNRGQVLSCVLNLDSSSPNANTVSLFSNGARVSQPQPLPDALKGKALFPAVAYKNVTLQVNFGPEPLKPLPFKCLCVGGASKADCEISTATAPAGGKYEVMLPIGLPDEGTFEWVDQFLAKNKNYIEISERMILDWAEKSGLARQGGYKSRTCNDKPEPNFGLPLMDNHSVRKILTSLLPTMKRNFIIVEVKGNLLADARKKILAGFERQGFRKTAQIFMGEPPAEWKTWVQDKILSEKKAKAEAEAKKKKAEAARKKAEEERKKKVEAERKKKIEAAKRAREVKLAAAKGEEPPPAPEEEKTEDAPMEEKAEEEPEEAIVVELTDEEKKLMFRKTGIPDLLDKELALSYTKFSLPGDDDGFDTVSYAWQPAEQCKTYLAAWVKERKMTQRVEELKPSEWFQSKLTAWQTALKNWKKGQSDWKNPAKRKAAEAEKAKKKEEEKKKKQEAGEEVPDEPEEEKKMDINAEDIDVFGVQDVMDLGNGEPLFANFVTEDWALLSLRYELHLLVHAFKHDLDDPERPTFLENHLAFYYNKYYKKTFNVSYYSVSKLPELVEMIKDTVDLNEKTNLVESQLSEDTPLDNFVKLTEDHRRDRARRLDAGDETALLKFKPMPPQGGGAPEGRKGGPPGQPSTRPVGGYKGGSYGGGKRPYSPGPGGPGYPPAQKGRQVYGAPSAGPSPYGVPRAAPRPGGSYGAPRPGPYGRR